MGQVLQRIFCTKDFLLKIVQKENRKDDGIYQSLYQILNKLGDTYVDITREELMALVKENPMINAMFKRPNRQFCASMSWKNVSEYAKSAGELYLTDSILNLDSGCLLLRDVDEDKRKMMKLVRRTRPFSLVPRRDRSNDLSLEYPESWADVFKSTKVAPISAMIISDNFMFTTKFESRKNNSLFAILKALVPSDIDIDFHLSIFFNNNNNEFDKRKAENLIKEIRELSLCREIKITIVAHSDKATTHDRSIVTNYHYITSGKGFSVIGEQIEEVASGEIKSVYHNIGDCEGSTVKHQQVQMLDWLKTIKQKKINGSGSYIVGDNINRLLD